MVVWFGMFVRECLHFKVFKVTGRFSKAEIFHCFCCGIITIVGFIPTYKGNEPKLNVLKLDNDFLLELLYSHNNPCCILSL